MSAPAVYLLASRRNGTLYVGVTSICSHAFTSTATRAAGFTRDYGLKLLSKPFHLMDLVAEVDGIFQTEDQHGRL